MKCNNCGAFVSNDAKFCAECGSNLENNGLEYPITDNPINEFQLQDNSFRGQNQEYGWNWWAFLFGPLWYISKGMVGKAIVIFLVTFIFGLIIPVVGGLPAWIYCGMKGNEDYHNHRGY